MANKKKGLKLNLKARRGTETPTKQGLTYNTTIIDRLAKKITFEVLDLRSNFSINGDTAFMSEGFMRVYNVLKFPAHIYHTDTHGYLSTILNSIRNTKGLEGVEFFLDSFNTPYQVTFDRNVKTNYENLIRVENTLKQQIATKNTERGSNSTNRDLRNMSTDELEFRLTEVRKKINSYEKIRANQARGRTQVMSYLFIRMVCHSKPLLKTAENKLISTLNGEDIQIRKVYNLMDYLESFSPISGLYNMDQNNSFAPNVFTSEGFTKLRNVPNRILENELEGLSRLICVGTEIYNDEPLGLTFTSSGEGQNIVIVGTTGSGKTYLYENLLLNAVLNDFKINAMDYKGKEYESVARLIPNSITLDLSLDSPLFVNTLKFIPELYEPEEREGAFVRNTQATIKSLCVLANLKEEHFKSAESLLDNLIRTVYHEHEVYYDKPSSYFKTRNIDFVKSMNGILIQIQQDAYLHKLFSKEVCREIFTGLAPYFYTNTYNSKMFSDEVDLKEVLTSDAIFYSFNMNQETPWNSLVRYQIFIQDYISNLFIKRNKKLGYTTLNSVEEYQRAVRYPESREIYNNKFSGGRSDNVVNVIMSNTIRPLLDQSLDTSAVRENVATLFIGKLKDMSALEDLCNTFEMSSGALDKIRSLKHYRHAFYVDYDTGVQKDGKVIRVIHPDHVIRYFETKRIDRAGEY